MDDFDWPHDRFMGPFPDFDLYDDDPSIQFAVQNDAVSFSHGENQVNFDYDSDFDCFHQQFEDSDLIGTHQIVSNSLNDSTFVDFDDDFDMGSIHPFHLELGLGLGFDDDLGDDINVNVNDAIRVSNESSSSVNDETRVSNESLSNVNRLRPIWIGSDSDCEVNVNSNEDDDDFVLDGVNDLISLELGNGDVEENRDFEWEDVNDGIDERFVSVLNLSGLEDDGEEVLFDVPSLIRDMDLEDGGGEYFGVGVGDDIYNGEYDIVFGHFGDGNNENAANAGLGLAHPPASKAFVENIPSVVITKEDLVDEKALCAVCKDLIEVGKEGKELPCSHWYHGGCIVPWLGIRNTCPVCRFELPTDDPDYEQMRTNREAHIA